MAAGFSMMPVTQRFAPSLGGFVIDKRFSFRLASLDYFEKIAASKAAPA
jgi:hypothetical protein